MTEIGAMGHSRGGEGVVWQVIVDRERARPVRDRRGVAAGAGGLHARHHQPRAARAVMLPYCDGDVSDLQGMHFYRRRPVQG